MSDMGNMTGTRPRVRIMRLVPLLAVLVIAALLLSAVEPETPQAGDVGSWQQFAAVRTAKKTMQRVKKVAAAVMPGAAMSTVATSTVISPAVTTTIVPSGPTLLGQGSRAGLSVGNTFPWLSEETLGAYLDDIGSLGVGWLRVDFAWDGVERTQGGGYDWSHLDRLVAAANARGIRILPILLAPPSWAREPSCEETQLCAPADPEMFARFAAAAARRYAPRGIHHWEIWNEPNMGRYWGVQGNVAGYAALLKTASAAIKAEDPNAVIITGGLAPAATGNTDVSTLDFIDGLYAAGVAGSFDAVGIHPYTYPTPVNYDEDWNAWMHMGTTRRSVRSIMVSHGDGGKKIWLTEYGAPTGGPGTRATIGGYGGSPQPDHVSEDLQALMLTEAFAAHAAQPWAGPLFWYAYKDLGTSPETNENFFGLRRADGGQKPAYVALKAAIAVQ